VEWGDKVVHLRETRHLSGALVGKPDPRLTKAGDLDEWASRRDYKNVAAKGELLGTIGPLRAEGTV